MRETGDREGEIESKRERGRERERKHVEVYQGLCVFCAVMFIPMMMINMIIYSLYNEYISTLSNKSGFCRQTTDLM